MENLLRYLKGGILGICLEYLYRVEYNPITLWICILLGISMILDLNKKFDIKFFFFKIFYKMFSFYVWLILRKKS